MSPEALKHHGHVVIPHAVDGEALADLKKELEDLLSDEFTFAISGEVNFDIIKTVQVEERFLLGGDRRLIEKAARKEHVKLRTAQEEAQHQRLVRVNQSGLTHLGIRVSTHRPHLGKARA